MRGHEAGYKKAEEVVRWCKDAGISYVTLFAFSTENWNRPKKEVGFLLVLLEKLLKEKIETLHKEGARIKIIGNRGRLPARLQKLIEDSEKKTAGNKAITVLIAFDYGGRDEIVRAAASIAKLAPKKFNEETFAAHLDTHGIPDPDIIVRTGGEMRLSGFLLWQAAYAELYFTKKRWPEFSKKDFDAALSEFAHRKRNFGK